MANARFYNKCWSTSDVASYLGVSTVTVTSYVRRGLLSAVDLSSGTSRPIYGFREEDVVDFSQRMKKKQRSDGHVSYNPPREKRKKVSNNKDMYILELREEIRREREKNQIMVSKIKELSDELLDIAARLYELKKYSN